ncbi:Bacterial membrane protein YfhO [Lignipirellula cremea]|uniref:Bacterial membrane protein YfhO n=1 Tax=Lignipirellula cremea TaxID=2528010 RepID=A0A518DY44_9BACT|nr:Bacterial membrane protein YfhO [Lignipirellula cremea]
MLLLLLAPGLWFYGRALSDSAFFYRDAGHYYYPLFTWTSDYWQRGEFPLWNPHENLGVPLAADPTASLFYPVKLIFLLPGVTPLGRYALYIALHGWGAAAALYWTARQGGASRYAAALAAVGYAFGGVVLMQYANIVYLAGAAWLPLALYAGERMLSLASWRWSIVCGALWAMIVLAGDPQTAYHAALLTALFGLLQLVHSPWRQPSEAEASTSLLARLLSARLASSCALLATAVLAGGSLAAVQILPAWAWSRTSDRVRSDSPRTIYEAVARDTTESLPTTAEHLAETEPPSVADTAWRRSWRGLFGPPPPGAHHHHVYLFSVGPWRLAEAVWPNFSGREFPTHRRWTRLFNDEDGAWTPSLYLGLGPLLLGLAVWTLRGGDLRLRWLSWMLLLSLLAAFGWYGLGWLIQGVRTLTGAGGPLPLGPQVGGLYWLLSTFLPGYITFRFPAKWLTPAALALCLLAAAGWDRLFGDEPQGVQAASRWGWLAGGLVGGTTLLAIATLARQGALTSWFATAPADPLFGPIQAEDAVRDLLLTFGQTIVVGLLWAVFLLRRDMRRWLPGLVALTAIELCLAHSWMTPVAPRARFAARPAILSGVAANTPDAAIPNEPAAAPVRFFRQDPASFLPVAWASQSSADRSLQNLAWSRDTLFPKYPMLHHAGLVEAYGSASDYDFAALMYVARLQGPTSARGAALPHPAVLDLLGARYRILLDDYAYPGDERVSLPPADEESLLGAQLWQSPQEQPLLWITHRVEVLPPLSQNSRQVEARTQQVLDSLANPAETTAKDRLAVLEAAIEPSPLPSTAAPGANGPQEGCRLERYEPNEVQATVRLQRPGLLVLADHFDEDWRAEVTTGQGAPVSHPILRTNRVLRGLLLPAGEHRVRFFYCPSGLRTGAVISLLGWSLLLLAGIAWCGRRWSKK